MAKLLLAIGGRVEEGEALSASVYNTATGTSALTGFSLQWQVLSGGVWTNVGTANSLTYTIPAGSSAVGKSYRLVSTPTGGDEASTSAATAPVVADTNKVHAPTLADVAASLTLAENAAATLLDGAVTFGDADNGNFGGGSLAIINSNSLAAGGDGLDLLSVRNQGTGAGQIAYNAATREVFFAAQSGNAVLIGVVDAVLGGNGADLKIAFNANATKAAIDKLIENIQFSNNDDSPTTARLLTIKVADATAGSVQRVMQVNVTPSADGPSFTGSSAFTIDENQTAAGIVAAVDPDREAGAAQGMSYSLVAGTGGTDNALFTVNAATGELSFLSAPDFEGAHSAAYSVRVRASDSNGGVVERVVTVQVLGVNEAPIAQALSATVQEDAASTTLAASFGDPDAGDSHTISLDTTGTIGTVTRQGSTFSYDAGAQFQSLGQGQTATDAFSYTVTDAGGLSSTRTATVTIVGANDAATIAGVASGSVQEDVGVSGGLLSTVGTLTVSDIDAGQSLFAAQTSVAGSAGLGTFSLSASGAWTYQVDNNSSTVQGLVASAVLTDSFIATSLDGTASQLVTATIRGSNDAAVVGGTIASDVYEDTNVVNGLLLASGVLSIADADAGQAQFVAQSSVPGDVFGGIFNIDANGAWTWQLVNNSPAGQVLTYGVSYPDSFTVTTADGTTQVVSVNVHGANDAASFSGVTSLALTEDVGVVNGYLRGSANAGIVDPDFNEARVPDQWQVPGTGGHGSFTVGGGSTWSYRANNSLEVVQALGVGQTLVDTLTVTTVDGSATAVLTATIVGSNDAPTAGPAGTGEVSEAGQFDDGGIDDGVATAQGVLSGQDADNGDALSWSGSSAGTYGEFSIAGNGHWEFVLDNAAAATQSLAEGQTVQEVFVATVTDSQGATAQQQVTITLHGTNDAPVVSYLSGISDFGGSAHGALGGGVLAAGLTSGYYHPIIRADESGDLLVIGPREANGYSTIGLERHYSDGSIDISFGQDGRALFPTTFAAQGLAIDGAGRSIAFGYAWDNYGEAATDWAICRFGPDGSLDSTFGNSGKVTLDFDGGYDYADSATFDNSGRLVVSGTGSDPVTGSPATVIARLTDDGSLDASFGIGGLISVDAGEAVHNVSLDSQDRVLVWGTAADPSTGEASFCVARFLTDGTSDTSFGTGGRTFLSAQGHVWGSEELAIGDDGSLVIAWSALVGNLGNFPLQLVKLTAHGSLDSNFGDGGRLSTQLSAADDAMLAIDAQGRVLAAFGDANGDVQLARFDSAGSLDTGFAGDGTAGVDFGGEDELDAMQLLPDGGIMLTGTTWGSAGGDGVAARFNADGSLDLAFGQPQPAKPTVSGRLYFEVDDPDLGDSAEWSGNGVGTYGTFTFNADATWTYVLDLASPATQALPAGQTAIEHFTATLTDSFGASITRDIEITIIGSYDPPAP